MEINFSRAFDLERPQLSIFTYLYNIPSIFTLINISSYSFYKLYYLFCIGMRNVS